MLEFSLQVQRCRYSLDDESPEVPQGIDKELLEQSANLKTQTTLHFAAQKGPLSSHVSYRVVPGLGPLRLLPLPLLLDVLHVRAAVLASLDDVGAGHVVEVGQARQQDEEADGEAGGMDKKGDCAKTFKAMMAA